MYLSISVVVELGKNMDDDILIKIEELDTILIYLKNVLSSFFIDYVRHERMER